MVSLSRARGGRGLRADINVTPLVDVVLVLLIIFMVITPLLHASRPLQLPAAQAASAASGEPLVLSVTADRALWLANEPIQEQALTQALSRRPGQELQIRADAALSMRELRPLLRLIKTAGLRRVAFAVTPARSR